MAGKLTWLHGSDSSFPPSHCALEEPNGLLAVGGDLSPQRLLKAYHRGIFPWFEQGQPILWWAPDPRMVLFPDECHISRSMAKVLRQGHFAVTADHAFVEVMTGCAAPRSYTADTWITPAMVEAYTRLHQIGWAHSIEVWRDDELVGGLYGVAIDGVFFGESMFSRRTNASKLALISLARKLLEWDYRLIDCQVASGHLSTLGAREIPRAQFESILRQGAGSSTEPGHWREAW